MTTMPTFSAGEYKIRVIEVQREFRRYDPISVLQQSLEYLYQPSKNPLGQLLKHPWLVMLLIKWVFQDESCNVQGRPPISGTQLVDILQQIYNLEDIGRMPDEYEDVSLFVRVTAYRQFYYQHKRGFFDIARQEALFSRVEDNHYFKARFEAITGVAVPDFMRLSIVLLSAAHKHACVIPRTLMFGLCPYFKPHVVDAFLRAVSIELPELPKTLKAMGENIYDQRGFLYQTPFYSFPLIKVGGQFWCVSPHVLHRGLGYFIYDLLKRDNVNRFNAPWGKAFEKYVGTWINMTSLPVATEEEQKSVLPGDGNLIDFLVSDGGANVLIDAKGVEMAQRGMVAHQQQIVEGATGTSLMKAFVQGHDLCSRLKNLISDEHPVIRSRPVNYLIVVTYKELYIGTGRALSSGVGEAKLSEIRNQYPADCHIPNENIFCLTVNEFEELMALVAKGKVGLVEALERAKRDDSDPMTSKFVFELHIRSWPESKGLNPLHEEADDIYNELRNAFPGVIRHA